MKHTILTALAATAIALSPVSAMPAKATDAGDLIGAVLGIAAIAAIANEVRDDRSGRDTPASRRAGSKPAWRHDDRRHERHRARVLPGECLRVTEGRRDDRIVFPEQCLNRAGIRDRDLPGRCETRLRTRSGRLDVYRARCLADAGWSLPRIATRR